MPATTRARAAQLHDRTAVALSYEKWPHERSPCRSVDTTRQYERSALPAALYARSKYLKRVGGPLPHGESQGLSRPPGIISGPRKVKGGGRRARRRLPLAMASATMGATPKETPTHDRTAFALIAQLECWGGTSPACERRGAPSLGGGGARRAPEMVLALHERSLRLPGAGLVMKPRSWPIAGLHLGAARGRLAARWSRLCRDRRADARRAATLSTCLTSSLEQGPSARS